MKKIVTLIAIFLNLLFCSAVLAKNIPLEVFAKFPQFRQLVISPTGQYLAANYEKNDGVPVVSIIDVTNMSILSSIEFEQEEQPGRITWLNNERVGISISIKLGSLDFPISWGDYYAMNADGTRKSALWGFRNESGHAVNPEVSSMQILHLLPEEDDTILVAENISQRADVAYTKAYKLDIYTGKKRKVASSPIRGARLLADHDANIRFASGVDPDDENKIKIYYRQENGDDWTLLNSFDEQQGKLTPIAFTADNNSVYALSDLDESVTGIVNVNLKDGQRTLLYRNERVDPDDIIMSHDMQLVAARITPDFTHNEILTDHSLGRWISSLQQVFPNQTVDITSTTRDEKQILLKVSSAQSPGKYYLFDAPNKKLKLISPASPWINAEQMSPVEPFTLQARDGTEVYGYLTLPKGKESNLPLIVYPHGGPHGPRDYWRFDSDAQMLANRGYAVLQLNFRGSGGYGRDYQYSGYGKWGAEMQDDLTDATLWAIQQGIADKDRVCIYGASYGGYAALMAVTKEPDLYQCAIGYVGVYSLPMMFEEGDIPGSQYGINFLKKALGEDKGLLKQRSPAFNADKIKAAIFLVQGGKDQRVPVEQFEAMKSALNQAGHPYQTLLKENEAHGFYSEENRIELYQRMLAFLDKHIGH